MGREGQTKILYPLLTTEPSLPLPPGEKSCLHSGTFLMDSRPSFRPLRTIATSITSSLKTSLEKKSRKDTWFGKHFPDTWKVFLLKITFVLLTFFFPQLGQVSRTDVYSKGSVPRAGQPSGYGCQSIWMICKPVLCWGVGGALHTALVVPGLLAAHTHFLRKLYSRTHEDCHNRYTQHKKKCHVKCWKFQAVTSWRNKLLRIGIRLSWKMCNTSTGEMEAGRLIFKFIFSYPTEFELRLGQIHETLPQ